MPREEIYARLKDVFQDVFDREKNNFPGWEKSLSTSFESMKNICERHRIRLVALDMPVLPRYRKSINSRALEAENAWWDRIEKFGIERLVVPVRLGEEHFFDTVHMVSSGAEMFTREVTNQLLALDKSR